MSRQRAAYSVVLALLVGACGGDEAIQPAATNVVTSPAAAATTDVPATPSTTGAIGDAPAPTSSSAASVSAERFLSALGREDPRFAEADARQDREVLVPLFTAAHPELDAAYRDEISGFWGTDLLMATTEPVSEAAALAGCKAMLGYVTSIDFPVTSVIVREMPGGILTARPLAYVDAAGSCVIADGSVPEPSGDVLSALGSHDPRFDDSVDRHDRDDVIARLAEAHPDLGSLGPDDLDVSFFGSAMDITIERAVADDAVLTACRLLVEHARTIGYPATMLHVSDGDALLAYADAIGECRLVD